MIVGSLKWCGLVGLLGYIKLGVVIVGWFMEQIKLGMVTEV